MPMIISCCWFSLFTVLVFLLGAWQVTAQYGYQMMAPQFAMVPPPMMVPQVQMQPQAMPMGYGGIQQQQPVSRGGRVQKGPWSECSKTCGVNSIRTRTYTPCDTSVSSCSEREGCMVPECGMTKWFDEGDEVKLPCHAEAGRKNYRGQWFTFDNAQHSWKYVSLEPNRKYMDKNKNLVIASAKVIDQGTYKCNLQSEEGTIVAEAIWHFSVNGAFNTAAAGGGGGAVCVLIILIIIGVCYFKYKKMKDGEYETKNRDKGRDVESYDYGNTGYGEDFDFGY